MFSQVQQALECLSSALAGIDAAPTAELRRTLETAKSLRSRVELLETRAASLIARRERHGDGGAGLLTQVGGRSRAEAARNVRTDAELAELPAAHTAVSEGEMSLANAAKLARAARKTSPDAVQGDTDLVQMAKTLPEDEFAQAAQRWTIRHQSTDDLAAQHRRNRRNRHVRFWNGDDGTVQMRGSFDAEMGARIQQRLRRQAEQLRQADRRRQTQSQSSKAALNAEEDHDAASATPSTATRSRDQRMADALDTLLSAAIETQPADSPDAVRSTAAEIIIRADLAALTGEPGGIAEICGIGPIPPSTLQRLACNSDVWIEVFGDELTPLYETVVSRAPTAAQRRALIARDGACIGCGEPPGECEAHHIIPCQSGGKTRLDNLVLVCWSCHDLIHDHNWRVLIRAGRYRLAPPDPAHRVNPAPQRKPKPRASRGTRNTTGVPPPSAVAKSLWEEPAA